MLVLVIISAITRAFTMKLMTWKKQKNHTTPIPSWGQEENSIYSTAGEEIRPLPPPLLLHPLHALDPLHRRPFPKHHHGHPIAEMAVHVVPLHLHTHPIFHRHLPPAPPTNQSSQASKNGYKRGISPKYNAESNQTQPSKSVKHSDPSKPS